MTAKTIPPLSHTELAAFCSQTAMVLKSGISILEGISIMLEDTTDKEEAELLTAIYDTLLDTGNFSEALEKTGACPEYFLHMVQIGEQTGRLDDVMQSLADYYEKEASLLNTIKNVITYPLIMLIMITAVILLLVMKVMPVFNQVFKQLGSEMSGFAKGILNVGLFLNRHFVWLICILAVIAILGVAVCKSEKLRRTFTNLVVKIPALKTLSEEIYTYRFTNGIVLTLSSGFSADECLRLSSDLVKQKEFDEKISKCSEEVSEGTDLCKSLLDHGIFTGFDAKLLSIGYKTGSVNEAMQKIAGKHEDEIDTRISGLIALVEPSLVMLLSIIVGIILLSVMVPLIGIMSGM